MHTSDIMSVLKNVRAADRIRNIDAVGVAAAVRDRRQAAELACTDGKRKGTVDKLARMNWHAWDTSPVPSI